MTSLRVINRRAAAVFAMSALLLATLLPGIVPAFASAATLTERSVELSSSSKGADGVNYTVGFTSVGAAKAVVLNFCSNTPLIEEACDAPGGFDISAATTSTGDFATTTGGANAANTLVLTGTIAAASPISIELQGVHNPTAAAPLYARILTYTGANTGEAGDNAKAYTATVPGTTVDKGSAAISITDTIGVSGAVLESMTFCVAGSEFAQPNCGDSSPLPPTLKLGETVNNITALTPTAVSTGSIYTQLSTNAASGAVVNLKSSASCGGLVRAGATSCDIALALNTDITRGQAKFGVKTATASNPANAQGGDSTGTYQAKSGSIYTPTAFALNYVAGNATGVSSAFGDPFLDTDGAPVSNKNMALTFGASISNSTPAGLYSTDLSLIATGKF
ncbi:hypothetical protein J0I05_00150 [Candidatus Saccharibacteria bacterium]|nr:hypothetical protein [Candidatus Saccharibacteria bacterium]